MGLQACLVLPDLDWVYFTHMKEEEMQEDTVQECFLRTSDQDQLKIYVSEEKNMQPIVMFL